MVEHIGGGFCFPFEDVQIGVFEAYGRLTYRKKKKVKKECPVSGRTSPESEAESL